jgi:ATP-dependent Clp protease ATP-binding subunit ClpX
MDTQDILFIAAGTFSDLHLQDVSKTVGFGNGNGDRRAADKSRTRRASEKELLEYGLLAEFLGRLPVRVELDQLSVEDLFLVMTAPPDSVVREYQALLKMDGVDLRFSDPALRAIANFCIRRKTGARSVRTFIEEICHDIMFEAPERKGETITIDADFAMARLERLPEGADAGA